MAITAREAEGSAVVWFGRVRGSPIGTIGSATGGVVDLVTAFFFAMIAQGIEKLQILSTVIWTNWPSFSANPLHFCLRFADVVGDGCY